MPWPRLVLVVALIACRGQERRCEEAFGALIDGPGVPKPAVLELARHCIDDGWEKATLTCVAAARDVVALEACTTTLSPTQRARLAH